MSGCITRDHPRVCGEQHEVEASDCTSEGSSPRVRGAVNTRHDDMILAGIIPACAGSRSSPQSTATGL